MVFLLPSSVPTPAQLDLGGFILTLTIYAAVPQVYAAVHRAYAAVHWVYAAVPSRKSMKLYLQWFDCKNE